MLLLHVALSQLNSQNAFSFFSASAATSEGMLQMLWLTNLYSASSMHGSRRCLKASCRNAIPSTCYCHSHSANGEEQLSRSTDCPHALKTHSRKSPRPIQPQTWVWIGRGLSLLIKRVRTTFHYTVISSRHERISIPPAGDKFQFLIVMVETTGLEPVTSCVWRCVGASKLCCWVLSSTFGPAFCGYK